MPRAARPSSASSRSWAAASAARLMPWLWPQEARRPQSSDHLGRGGPPNGPSGPDRDRKRGRSPMPATTRSMMEPMTTSAMDRSGCSHPYRGGIRAPTRRRRSRADDRGERMPRGPCQSHGRLTVAVDGGGCEPAVGLDVVRVHAVVGQRGRRCRSRRRGRQDRPARQPADRDAEPGRADEMRRRSTSRRRGPKPPSRRPDEVAIAGHAVLRKVRDREVTPRPLRAWHAVGERPGTAVDVEAVHPRGGPRGHPSRPGGNRRSGLRARG